MYTQYTGRRRWLEFMALKRLGVYVPVHVFLPIFVAFGNKKSGVQREEERASSRSPPSIDTCRHRHIQLAKRHTQTCRGARLCGLWQFVCCLFVVSGRRGSAESSTNFSTCIDLQVPAHAELWPSVRSEERRVLKKGKENARTDPEKDRLCT